MMNNYMFQKLTQFTHKAIAKLTIRSALNPCLYLCGIISLPFLIVSVYLPGFIQIAAISLSAIPIIIFAIGFLYLMIKNPDKLQSESYQLRKQALELIEEKGSNIQITATSVSSISNPELTRLASGENHK